MREINYPQFFKLALGATLLTGCANVAHGEGTRTPTPFMPEIPSGTNTPSVQTIETPPFPTLETTSTPSPTETLISPVPYHVFGVDFSDLSKGLSFILNSSTGKSFSLNTKPTLVCNDKKEFAPKELTSCEYPPKANPEDLFHFTHSGYWHDSNAEKPVYIEMPAEALRHYLEDKYYPEYCRGGCKEGEVVEQVSEEERSRRMAEFIGTPVQVIQENGATVDLKVLGIIRVPPEKLGPFLSDSTEAYEDIIKTLSEINPDYAKYKIDGTPEIFVIFCGWYNPNELKNLPAGAERPNSYSWSRYVIVVGK
jgi:hypothetical protein